MKGVITIIVDGKNQRMLSDLTVTEQQDLLLMMLTKIVTDDMKSEENEK